ncbi:hypothetical protein C9374_013257 [Naegleria lovaniensis]|uniref:MPN domain-containing protein n=1 Tax=Naegleria lovaniensis TaxID=51637 RepID=A0AA88H1W7_NAELO|nr:uncharacterized protein C9374_013257 [Naegleria lovaniensis]KAG2391772.1 hypothetical protein C9374_013257 [Naegleria lovaniensis]
MSNNQAEKRKREDDNKEEEEYSSVQRKPIITIPDNRNGNNNNNNRNNPTVTPTNTNNTTNTEPPRTIRTISVEEKSDDNSVYIVKKGDFSTDRTICHMKEEKSSGYNVIIEQSVICGIIDHAYSDHHNEIIGLLGGFHDAKTNTVYVSCFKALAREVENIAIDGVTCSPNEIILAQEFFQTKDLTFCGWYHSHPRIPPFPSMKDLQMQYEMQMQAAYSFGIICSSFFSEGTTSKKSDLQNFYINCFRVHERQGSFTALKVEYSINNFGCLKSESQVEMVNTMKTCFQEAKETYSRLMEESIQENNLEKQLYIMSKYQSFLFEFWNGSINQRIKTLRQDISNMRAQNLHLRQKLDQQNRRKTVFEPKEKKTKTSGIEKLIHGNKSISLNILHKINDHNLDVSKIIEDERECMKYAEEEDVSEDSVQLLKQISNTEIPLLEFPDPPIQQRANNSVFFIYRKFILNGETFNSGENAQIEISLQNGLTKFLAKICEVIRTDVNNPDKFHGTHLYLHYFHKATLLQSHLSKDIYDKYFSDAGEDEYVFTPLQTPTHTSMPKKLERVAIYDYSNYINFKFGGRNDNSNTQVFYCRYQLISQNNTVHIEDVKPEFLDKAKP